MSTDDRPDPTRATPQPPTPIPHPWDTITYSVTRGADGRWQANRLFRAASESDGPPHDYVGCLGRYRTRCRAREACAADHHQTRVLAVATGARARIVRAVD